MSADTASCLDEIETRLQMPLPAEYAEYLIGNPEGFNGDYIVTIEPDYFGVALLFGLSCPDWMRADRIHAALDDVLPPGTFPIANDIGGNLYLIDCTSSSTRGHILWWNHERDLGDISTKPVSGSFSAFLASLVPAED